MMPCVFFYFKFTSSDTGKNTKFHVPRLETGKGKWEGKGKWDGTGKENRMGQEGKKSHVA